MFTYYFIFKVNIRKYYADYSNITLTEFIAKIMILINYFCILRLEITYF